MTKDLLTENDNPKRLTEIRFGMFSGEELSRVGRAVQVTSHTMHKPDGTPEPYGVLDTRMGTGKGGHCETCNEDYKSCPGHFGFVKLALPIFHVGYFRSIIVVLQTICKSCSRVMVSDEDRLALLRRLRHPQLDTQQRKHLQKEVISLAKKRRTCPACHAVNGTVKKVPPLKIVHMKYAVKGTRKDDASRAYDELLADMEFAARSNPEVQANLKQVQEDLNPLRCLELLQKIPNDDCELLLMDGELGRPERMILTHLLVPPIPIRPSVGMQSGQSNEDDLTVKIGDMVFINNEIRHILDTGLKHFSGIQQQWDHLQVLSAMYINGDVSMPPALKREYKLDQVSIRAFAQRLKGKKGRFRGNLSGKRVNYSARTVISPDPNLRIDQVAVPVLVAKVLTYPERVNAHNMERLKQAVLNGPDNWPGARDVEKTGPDDNLVKFALRSRKVRQHHAASLKPGDIVHRHLVDGDVVLFNRQPSLHRISIMSHFAKVMEWRTFRFNECCCGPYNADFDGDEMNLHLPQTEEARAEAMVLMNTKANLITPCNGKPLIAATQDFITASFLTSRRGVFFTRQQFSQVISHFSTGQLNIDLPKPCIIKPVELWSGKQVFGVLLNPIKAAPVLINLEGKSNTYSGKGQEMCVNDGFVLIRNSELLCGPLDKKTVGGAKNTIFYHLLREYGQEAAADRMSRLARLCARYLGERGFSIGIEDVTPSQRLAERVDGLCTQGYKECDGHIRDYKDNKLRLLPGCTPEESLEAEVMKVLNNIRNDAGKACLAELPRYNSPMIMAQCGSKGSETNISQMDVCVGNQVVNGARIPDGFESRSLPHFPRHSKTPQAKGFVRNSFYSGLTPTEFFFHTMAGREGLVDTAVKTATTGYAQRRLVKGMEDLVVHYDYSVRMSDGRVVQFRYGDDALDPIDMEGEEKPIDFDKAMSYVLAMKDLADGHRALAPAEMRAMARNVIGGKRYEKFSALFRDELLAFIDAFADKVAKLRGEHGLDPENDSKGGPKLAVGRAVVDGIMHLTGLQLDKLLETCAVKYEKAMIEPGTAVGALAAQSIGEPTTQMTLKTFHFAGVASMNVTLGVPRIEEIINGTKAISTPIIKAPLTNPHDEKQARVVKGLVEQTYLKDVAQYIEERVLEDSCYVNIKLDHERIRLLKLDITVETVRDALIGAPAAKLKIKLASSDVAVFPETHSVRVRPPEMKTKSKDPKYTNHIIEFLVRTLPDVVVCGIAGITRAVINKPDTKEAAAKEGLHLVVEGNQMLRVMATPGVVGTKVVSNHVMEMERTLGIEAARETIVDQINFTMSSYSIQIDRRHLMLLADLMTFKGEVLGIQRHGIGKMKESTLNLASFERTTDILFDAAARNQRDPVEGVSECIIMGIPTTIGTGLFKLLREPGKRFVPKTRTLLFDNADFSLPV